MEILSVHQYVCSKKSQKTNMQSLQIPTTWSWIWMTNKENDRLKDVEKVAKESSNYKTDKDGKLYNFQSLNLMTRKICWRRPFTCTYAESPLWIQNQKWLIRWWIRTLPLTNRSKQEHFGRCLASNATVLNIWMVVLFQTIKLVSETRDNGNDAVQRPGIMLSML